MNNTVTIRILRSGVFRSIKVSFDPSKPVLFMFDIDGVACLETKKYMGDRSKITNEQIEEEQKSCVCTQEFIATYFQLKAFPNVTVRFNTGRKKSVKAETFDMFKNAGIFLNKESDIIFYPENKKWMIDEYSIIKSNVVFSAATQYNTTIYVDDTKKLIKYIISEQKKRHIRNIYPILYKANSKRISSLKMI